MLEWCGRTARESGQLSWGWLTYLFSSLVFDKRQRFPLLGFADQHYHLLYTKFNIKIDIMMTTNKFTTKLVYRMSNKLNIYVAWALTSWQQ